MAVPAPDLAAAAAAVDLAKGVVETVASHLHGTDLDANQVVAYDFAHAASAVENARAVLDYGAKGDVEARITCAFVADSVYDLMVKVLGREAAWGVSEDALAGARPFVAAYRSPEYLAAVVGEL